MGRVKDERGCCAVSSGHNMATALMNSQLLQLPTQDVHKIKPKKLPAKTEDKRHSRPHPDQGAVDS